MTTVAQQLRLAWQHHGAGRLREAGSIAQEILRKDSKQVEAAHLLAVIAHESGSLEAALHWARQAVAAKPQSATYHRTLGVVLRSMGKLDEAIACYQKCIELRPGDAIAYFNLGNALRDQGRLMEAGACYEGAIKLKPTYVKAHHNQGKILQSLGRLKPAVSCYREALKLKPDLVEAHVDLGNALSAQKKLGEAASAYLQALRYDPRSVKALNNLANTLSRQGKYEAAMSRYQKALHLEPNNPQLWHNLGTSLKDVDQLDKAAECYRRAITSDPNYVKSHCNLGDVRVQQRDFQGAMESYDKALSIQPEYPEAHLSRAHLWLLQGDFERGWPEYAWRSRVGRAPRFGQPQWDGGPLDGKTILLFTEQGFGDAFQFIRYAPLVKQQGGTVLLACRRRMIDVLSRCPGIDQVVAREDKLPAFDVQCSLMSLPSVLATTTTEIPADVPYIFSDPQQKEYWQQRLAGLEGLKTGIAWQGSVTFAHDRIRSIPLEHFAPLAEVKGVQLISLQKGPGIPQLASLRDRFQVTNLGAELDEQTGAFVETAAAIDNLDLVITSDTAVAHLAGALGAPVWVALFHVPEWRWQLDREDSPWYSTMRLFRQPSRHDWTSVISQIQSALAEFVATRGIT